MILMMSFHEIMVVFHLANSGAPPFRSWISCHVHRFLSTLFLVLHYMFCILPHELVQTFICFHWFSILILSHRARAKSGGVDRRSNNSICECLGASGHTITCHIIWQAPNMLSKMESNLQTSFGVYHSLSGWCFGCHFWHFPRNMGFLIIPTDFHIFQRGGPTTNQLSMIIQECGGAIVSNGFKLRFPHQRFAVLG